MRLPDDTGWHRLRTMFASKLLGLFNCTPPDYSYSRHMTGSRFIYCRDDFCILMLQKQTNLIPCVMRFNRVRQSPYNRLATRECDFTENPIIL